MDGRKPTTLLSCSGSKFGAVLALPRCRAFPRKAEAKDNAQTVHIKSLVATDIAFGKTRKHVRRLSQFRPIPDRGLQTISRRTTRLGSTDWRVRFAFWASTAWRPQVWSPQSRRSAPSDTTCGREVGGMSTICRKSAKEIRCSRGRRDEGTSDEFPVGVRARGRYAEEEQPRNGSTSQATTRTRRCFQQCQNRQRWRSANCEHWWKICSARGIVHDQRCPDNGPRSLILRTSEL